VAPGSQQHGRDGLLRVVERLQGFEAAAGAWEREILAARDERLPARLASTSSASPAKSPGAGSACTRPRATRAGGSPPPCPWRCCCGAIFPGCSTRGPSRARWPPRRRASPPATALDVLAHLERAGASFVEDIAAGVRRLRIEVEEGLCELVTAGLVAGDGFAGLRSLLHSEKTPPAAPRPAPPPPAPRPARALVPARPARRAARRRPGRGPRRQYVRRYGVVFRDLLQREPGVPAWRDLLRVYRRLEMRGDLRGGRIVGGFVGEQFAASEALETLRAIRRAEPAGQIVSVSACDPLNLSGS